MRLFAFYLSLGLIPVCEIELSHMGKNNRHPDLVCENFCLLLLPLWESVIVLCFVVCYFMSILVLQSS